MKKGCHAQIVEASNPPIEGVMIAMIRKIVAETATTRVTWWSATRMRMAAGAGRAEQAQTGAGSARRNPAADARAARARSRGSPRR